ncbi:hypothetical protein [Nocardia sp. bgisy118]|uniref:hypothetical protein n=1 Tax=Nocardia sp. bgisy118 TaxID=3413786 RepID=UPI003F4A304F
MDVIDCAISTVARCRHANQVVFSRGAGSPVCQHDSLAAAAGDQIRNESCGGRISFALLRANVAAAEWRVTEENLAGLPDGGAADPGAGATWMPFLEPTTLRGVRTGVSAKVAIPATNDERRQHDGQPAG